MPDPSRLALVVGCGSYDDSSLQALQATLTDVAAITDVLRDEGRCRFDSCVAIVDKSKAEVEREVHRFLKTAPFESLVLLYFTGHGIKDDLGHLYFAQKDTEADLLESTAVSADFIRRQMGACASDRKVLLLDCCFAGAFPKGSKAGGAAIDFHQTFGELAGRGRGFFVISATGEFQFAYSDGAVQALGGPEPSLFTKHLVHGLRTGEADTDDNGQIKVHELFDYVQHKVSLERPGQTPKLIADFEEDFILAIVPPVAGVDVGAVLTIESAEAQIGARLPYRLPSGTTTIIEVAPNTPEGHRIVLPGEGEAGRHGGAPGDLVLTIQIKAHDPIPGANIFANLSLSAETAEVGTVASVSYPGGVIGVDIPTGTKDGATIEVPGKGRLGQHGGPPGSLIVTVSVTPGDPVRGDDFTTILELSPEEAIGGVEKSLETPSGSATVAVPPGVSDGFRFEAIRGFGYPGRFGGQAGDAIVTARIAYPKPADRTITLDLTPEEAEQGGVKELVGPWGRYEYATPAHATDGHTARINGLGEPCPYGKSAGDLVVTFQVETPQAQTPDDEPTPELERLRAELAEIDAALQATTKPTVWVGVGAVLAAPIGILAVYLVIVYVTHLPILPKEIPAFVDRILPGVAWFFGAATELACFVLLIDAVRVQFQRARLRDQIRRLESQ